MSNLGPMNDIISFVIKNSQFLPKRIPKQIVVGTVSFFQQTLQNSKSGTRIIYSEEGHPRIVLRYPHQLREKHCQGQFNSRIGLDRSSPGKLELQVNRIIREKNCRRMFHASLTLPLKNVFLNWV